MTFTGSKDVQLTIGTGPDHGIFDVHIGGSLWQSIDGYASTAGQRVIAMPVTRTEARALEIRSRADKNRGSSGYVVRFKQLTVAASYVERTIDYTYDALSRLTEADYGSTTYTYGYDLAGNLTHKNGTARTFNAGNQMTSDGTNTLTYDSNGNLTNDGTNAYTWDRANRMLEVDNGTPADLTAYAYDGLNNRISQAIGTTSPVVTQYLLDTQPGLTKVLAQTTGGNTDRFIHTPHGIHAMENNAGEWSYMVQDGLGSVRGEVGASMDIAAIQSYEPFGQRMDVTSSFDSPFGFTGEQTDPTGQLYLRARYYDPGLGVFTARDPFEGVMDRAMSLNGYSWVEGNVPNMVDPSGMSPCTQRGTCDEIRKNSSNYSLLEILGCLQVVPSKCCGPDITQWLMREVVNHVLYASSDPNIKAPRGIAGAYSILETENLQRLAAYGLAVDYGFIPYTELATQSAMTEGKSYMPDADSYPSSCRATVTVCGECRNATDFGNFIFGLAMRAAGWPYDVAILSTSFNFVGGIDPTIMVDTQGIVFGYSYLNSIARRSKAALGSVSSFCDSLKAGGRLWYDAVQPECNIPCSEANLNCARNSTAYWNEFVSRSLGGTLASYLTPSEYLEALTSGLVKIN